MAGVGALQKKKAWRVGGRGVGMEDQSTHGQAVDVWILVQKCVQVDGEMLNCW